MLTLTRKEYEIEEPIVLKNENGDTIYQFDMKITSEEMEQLKNLIFDERDVKNGRKLSKLELEGKIEEYEELEAKVLENAQERQEKIEKICFKEHKESFKKVAGEYKYNEMVEMIFDFFVKTFADKKSQQINTMSSHLKKISNN